MGGEWKKMHGIWCKLKTKFLSYSRFYYKRENVVGLLRSCYFGESSPGVVDLGEAGIGILP